MPASSLIVGVDLAPIKPIPRTVTLQADITTDKCGALIRKHLKTWKADTVLHDGAPNVGVAWVQDAFSQAELALQALKLATDFLIEGGTFVTKLFRSKDYNALLWVCNQLFAKVEATKPPSSRNVSAEIFVVCQRYKAPKRIDPRLLDPRSVFAELLDTPSNNEAKVFDPEKKKRKRQGYEDGDHTQFKESPASDFIQTTDPIGMLGSLSILSFEQSANSDIALAMLDKLPETTQEIKNCCSDLKVLGRKEFRLLLRWRLKARQIFGLRTRKTDAKANIGEEVAEVTPMDEELKIQAELQRIDERERGRKKREKRRDNERRQREVRRMQLHMVAPAEIGLEQAGPPGEDCIFALAAVNRAGAIERVAMEEMTIPQPAVDYSDGDNSEIEDGSDREEDRLDRELDSLYTQYQERKSRSDAKHRAKISRNKYENDDWAGFSDTEQSDPDQFEAGSDSDSDLGSAGDRERITSWSMSNADVNPRTKGNGLTRRAAAFFDQDIFREMSDLVADESDSAIDMDSGDSKKEAAKDVPVYAGPSVDDCLHVFANPEVTTNHSRCPHPENTAEQHQAAPEVEPGAPTENDNQIAGFEVLRDPEDDWWDRQGEPWKDGRLGNAPVQYLYCGARIRR